MLTWSLSPQPPRGRPPAPCLCRTAASHVPTRPFLCLVINSPPADNVEQHVLADQIQMGKGGKTAGQVFSELGFGGMWGGLGTRVLMIGTLTGEPLGMSNTRGYSWKATMPLPPTGTFFFRDEGIPGEVVRDRETYL